MNQTYLHYLLFALCKLIHKKHLIALSFIFLTGLVAISSSVHAQTTPQQITYQGKLVQDGVPFSGSTTMIFELVNPTTNAIAWTETQTINVQDGLYSVVLGVQTPFTPNFFSQNPSLGLRVSVNGNALTPITVLRAVPYAHAAGSVADNSITSVKIVNGTIQTIDIASGGQNKILATDANGLVVWIDRTSITTATPSLQQVLNTSNDAGNNKITNLASPTDPQDAANKAYVDASTGASSQDLSTDATLLISGSGTYNGATAQTISVADGGITTNKIANGTIQAEDIRPNGGTNDQVLVSNGSTVAWTPTNTLSVNENDPKVGTTLISGTLPVWNGTTLDNSSITDNGGDVEVNPSADFSVNASGDISLNSLSGNVNINSTNTALTGNLSVGNDFILNSQSVDDIVISTLGIGSNSDTKLVTEKAVEDYVSSQISSIIENDPKVGTLTNDAIPVWNGISLEDGSITDDGTNLSTAGTFTFLNSNPIVFKDIPNGGFTNTLAFESVMGDNRTITFPDASGTVLLEGNLSNNFANGLTILSSNPSKIGLGGQLIEDVLISGFDGSVNHNFDLINMGLINFQANTSLIFNSSIVDATNTVFSVKNTVVGLPSFSSDATNSAFKTTAYINGDGSEFNIVDITTSNSLFDLYNTSGLNNLDIDLGIYDLGIFTSAGEINFKAQDFDDGSNLYEAATFLLEGGDGDGLRGGHAILNGGNGGSAAKGTVFLQDDGGNIEMGDNSSLNSELTLNGFLTLPNLVSFSPSSNNLYAQGGALYWGDENLSAGADTWEKIDANNIFYKGGTNSEVGIGAFSSTFDPLANLHIRKVATSADLKITTLRAAGETSKLYFQSATNNLGTATNSNISDILGEILFEGHDGTNFQEAAKIDVRATSANAATSEMRFFVDGTQKLSIHNDFDLNLGTTLTGPGGGVFLTAQSSDENTASSTGGYINMFAGSNIQPDGVGGNINIYAGGGGTSGGNVDINAGGGLTRGLVMMQIGGGNVRIGNSGSNDSELQLNGFLTLPNLVSFSPSSNNLYAQGGDLFWGSTNLSASGSSPWINDGSDNLYYPTNNGTVGIGDFSSLAPQADLHIKRIGTGIPANIRLTSAQELSGVAAPNNVNDIIGEMVFEGFSNDISTPFFKEVGKIDMITTSNDSSGLEADMRFTTNNVDRMRITSDGKVGIGNFPALSIFPSADLHILSLNTEALLKLSRSNGLTATDNSDVLGTLGFEGTNTNLDVITAGKIDVIVDGATSLILPSRMVFSVNDNTGILQERMRIQNDGIVFIGNPPITTNPMTNSTSLAGDPPMTSIVNLKLAVQGDIAATGDVYANTTFSTSDARFKKNIQTLQNPLNNILKMRGVSYNWRTEEFADRNFDTDLQVGLIAQEVAQIYPEAVETRYDGYLSVNYSSLVPVLIEATKEQQTIIDNQKEEINTQKTELEELKKQINELKQIVASLQENENSKENSNSALAQKVEALEKQLTALVESLSNKIETTQTASLKEEE